MAKIEGEEMRTAFISGRLGKDPLVSSPESSEYSVLKFIVANNDESRKNQNGEYESITNWFDIEYWTKKPQYWINLLTKGTEVVIECDVKQDQWEQEGQKRSRIKFAVKRGTFPLVIPSRNSGINATQTQEEPGEDDIPF